MALAVTDDEAQEGYEEDDHSFVAVAVSGHTPPHGVPVIDPQAIIDDVCRQVKDRLAAEIMEQLGGGGGPPGGGSPPPPDCND